MIAILTTRHGPGLGAEAVLEQCLKGRSSSHPPLTIVAPPGSRIDGAAGSLGLPVVPLDTTRESLLQNLRAARHLKDRLADCRVVHAWTARALEPALLLARALDIPATATLHDHPSAGFLSRPRRKLLRWSAGQLAALVCVSDAVRQACREHGFSPRLEVIHNGLADRPLTRTAPETVRVGFLGMYAAWKGFDAVADWIEHMPAPNITWHLYGDVAPAYRARAGQLAHDRNGRVFLHGRVDPEDIFPNIDVLVHASTSFDPLPTVLLEAARAGVPAVASSLGGAGEIVDSGNTGFLFDPLEPGDGRSSLLRLVEDEDLRVTMGAAARRKYEADFAATRMADAYAAFWRSIASPPGQGPV